MSGTDINQPVSIPDLEEIVLDAPADAGVAPGTSSGEALDIAELEHVVGGARRGNIVQAFPATEYP